MNGGVSYSIIFIQSILEMGILSRIYKNYFHHMCFTIAGSK